MSFCCVLAELLDDPKVRRDQKLYVIYKVMRGLDELVVEYRSLRTELADLRERLKEYEACDPSCFDRPLEFSEYRKIQAGFARAERPNLPIEERIATLQTIRARIGVLPDKQANLLAELEERLLCDPSLRPAWTKDEAVEEGNQADAVRQHAVDGDSGEA